MTIPASDREQLVVTLELPEGTHLETTDETARAYVREPSRDPDVVSTSTFVGRSTPAFYRSTLSFWIATCQINTQPFA